MHQNHVTGRGRILDDLERYPIDFFDTFVKPCDTGFRIAVYRSRFWRGCVAHRGCGGSRICSGLRASRIDPMAALRSNSTITKLPRLNSLPRLTLTKSPQPISIREPLFWAREFRMPNYATHANPTPQSQVPSPQPRAFWTHLAISTVQAPAHRSQLLPGSEVTKVISAHTKNRGCVQNR